MTSSVLTNGSSSDVSLLTSLARASISSLLQPSPTGLPSTFSTMASLAQANFSSSDVAAATSFAPSAPASDSLSAVLPVTQPALMSAPPPSRPTPTGPYTAWTVASGDSGFVIASEVGVPFFAISYANPTVPWTAITVGQTLKIPPSPTALAQVTGRLADKTPDGETSSTTLQANYIQYKGDGSTGWPTMDDWPTFEHLLLGLKTSIGTQCGKDVPGNSPDENEHVKNSIKDIAAKTDLDPRFILAVMIQESNGCVRVQTTSLANSNTGLLRSFKGKESCNHNGSFDNPCPSATIDQMVADGVAAPVDGVTLVKALNQAAAELPDAGPAQVYYPAARYYNSGSLSLPPETKGDLGNPNKGATLCYASDIANRLMGWTPWEDWTHSLHT